MGESVREGVVAKWLKQRGDAVLVGEALVEIETDKVTVSLPAPVAGVVEEITASEGTTVAIGQIVGRIAEGASNAVAGPPPMDRDRRPERVVVPSRLSPSARKALREHGELPRHLDAQRSIVAPAPTLALTPAAVAPQPVPAALDPREDVVAMTPIRKRIAERLVQAQHTAAVLTTFNEVDMSAVMNLRERHQDAFSKRHGVKLGYMTFFAKACVAALQEFGGLNAEMRGDTIVYKKHYDIGVAVGGGRGLVVPVVRDADRLSFAEFERRVAEFGRKAKDNTLTLDELSGGTFSITNGGIYGSMMSTPVLNFPQTGILGMHNIVRRPVVVGDVIEARPMMYLALSYDHRVVDGREAVQFLVSVKQKIEAPERLLFEI